VTSPDLINELLKSAQVAELNGNIDEATLLYQKYYSQRPFDSQYFPNLTTFGYGKEPRLSIILPCHNSAKYIEECIDSILHQSFTDFELIIVDDGSSDNSFALILEKALSDQRILVIRNLSPSGSAGLPRNQALKIARGELIGFVDSDDWVGPLYFETLVQALDEHNADLCISNGFINHQGENFNQRFYPDKWEIKSSNPNLACTHMSSMIWDKIYKKSLLNDNNIILGSYPAAVDVPFIFKAYYYCAKPVTANTIDYHYRRETENSVTVRFRKGSSCDFELKAYQEIFDWSDHCQLPESFKNFMRIKCLASFIYTCKLVKVDYFSNYFDKCRAFLLKLSSHSMTTSITSSGQKNLLKAYDCFASNSKKDFAALERPQLLPYFLENDRLASLPKSITIAPKPSNKQKRNIVFFPDWSSSNPYQSLFYSNLRKNEAFSSFDILGLSINDVNQASLSTLVSDFGFIHIHWMHPFISTDKSTDMFIDQINAVKSEKNAVVVWTVHNTVSHECLDREAELSRRRKVSRVCDRFIVHSDHAAKSIRTLYDIPMNRIFVIPHGKYDVDHSVLHPLIYDSLNNRKRMRLSILGDLRKYKNAEWAVDFLSNLNSSIDSDIRIELRLAGQCISQDQHDFFQSKADQHDFISLKLKRLSDSELMSEFCESDFIFAPYSHLLTSGICLNALSHGRPFIAPHYPSLSEFGSTNNSILYDSHSDLATSLLKMNDFFHRGLLGYVFDPKEIVASSSFLEWEAILSSLPSNPFA